MDIEYVDFINEYYEQAKIVYSDMKRETGEDYILHPINVAYILAELKMDPVTIACALIHEAISLQKMTYEEIEEMLDCLNSRDKELFKKYYLEDFDLEEIAVDTNTNVSNLYNRLSRGRRKIKENYMKKEV